MTGFNETETPPPVTLNTPTSDGKTPPPVTDEYGNINREETGNKNTPSSTEENYAFAGAVIRLDHGHFARWQKSFSNIPNLMALLESRDGWLATQSEADRKKWPHSTSAWLVKKDAEFASAPKQADPDAEYWAERAKGTIF